MEIRKDAAPVLWNLLFMLFWCTFVELRLEWLQLIVSRLSAALG